MNTWAQSIAEYGSWGKIRAGIELLYLQFTTWLRSSPPEMWLVLGAIAIVAFWIFNRRRRH